MLHNSLKNKKDQLLVDNDLLFQVAFGLWIISEYFLNSFFSVNYSYYPFLVLKIISVLLFVFCILFFHRNIKTFALFFMAFWLLILCISNYLNKSLLTVNDSIFTWLIFLAASNIDFKKICKSAITIQIICSIFIILSAKLGIITDYISIYEGRVRDCLGATYVGFLPINFCNIFFCCLYVYLPNKKMFKKNWWILIALNLIELFFYKFTDVRQILYIIIVTDLLYLVIININLQKLNVFKYISMSLWPLFAFGIYKLSLLFSWGNYKLSLLNHLLSARLQFNQQALYLYPINLFGNYISYNMGSSIRSYADYFYIDTGYIETLLKSGIIILLILIGVYVYLTKKSFEDDNKILFLWFTILSVMNMINNFMFNLVANISILSFWMFNNENLGSQEENDDEIKEEN